MVCEGVFVAGDLAKPPGASERDDDCRHHGGTHNGKPKDHAAYRRAKKRCQFTGHLPHGIEPAYGVAADLQS